jgi:L-lactate dehydrogenase (cytochrome)
VLRGVEDVDLSVTVMGQKLALPVYCSPTALQRLFHYQGERAVAAAAAKFGTIFGVSSLGTVSLEELRKAYQTPQVYQFYFHKDRGLNRVMLQRATSRSDHPHSITSSARVSSAAGTVRLSVPRSAFADLMFV